MEIEEVVKKRRGVRKFKDKEVSLKDVEELITLSNLSPSAGNIQARSVIIVKDKKIKDELKKTCPGFLKFPGEIPLIIVVLAKVEESALKYSQRGKDLYALQDATIFASYFQLLAVSKGLATRWVGSFKEGDLKRILNLPDDLRPIAMLPLGYPDEITGKKEIKPLEEIIYKEL